MMMKKRERWKKKEGKNNFQKFNTSQILKSAIHYSNHFTNNLSLFSHI